MGSKDVTRLGTAISTGGASEIIPKDKLTMSNIQSGISSATGSTARRQAAQSAQNRIEDVTAASTAPASALGEALRTKRQEMEAQPQQQYATLAPTPMNRADIPLVGANEITAAGVTAANRPDTAIINQAQQAQFRQQQMNLGAQLAAQAAGEGITPAQLQLRRATEQNIAQQAAMRAGAVGPQAALARREAGRTGAALSQQGAEQAALLRAQEISQAQQNLTGLAQGARAQDIGLATSQAGLEQETSIKGAEFAQQANLQRAAQQQQALLANADNKLKADLANQGVSLDILKSNAARGDAAALANLQTQLAQQGMSNEMIKAYLASEVGLAGGVMGGALQGLQIGQAAQAAAQTANAAQQASMIGAGGTLGAAAIAASDINLKKNIKDGKKSIGEFLAKLNSYDYDYKDDKFGKGKQNSVMAQELEQSDVGKKAVIDTPEGKMVDYSTLLPSMLAGLSETYKKVMSLEEALKNKKRGN